jgi:Rod binding domain-containing protein
MQVDSSSALAKAFDASVLPNNSIAPKVRPPSYGPASPAEIKKLRKAASEFEAMLITNWWTSMKDSGMSDGDDSSDPGKSTLDQLGMQAISSAISSGKGFGIGDMLVRGLLRSHPELTGGEPSQP